MAVTTAACVVRVEKKFSRIVVTDSKGGLRKGKLTAFDATTKDKSKWRGHVIEKTLSSDGKFAVVALRCVAAVHAIRPFDSTPVPLLVTLDATSTQGPLDLDPTSVIYIDDDDSCDDSNPAE